MFKKLPPITELIDPKKCKIKVCGIYRIYFQTKQSQYSYIGVSKDIRVRIKSHYRMLNKILNWETDDYAQYCNNLIKQQIPIKTAIYWKMASFMYNNKLTLNDWSHEIVLEKAYDKIEEIEFIEMAYIDLYNSEKWGFNGAFAKFFKFARAIEWIESLDWSEKKEKQFQYNRELALKEGEKIKKWGEELIKIKDPKVFGMDWIPWQIITREPLKLMKRKDKENINQAFAKYCFETFEKALTFCPKEKRQEIFTNFISRI